jgi:predicted TIM-barrel fold metal-dependent hydrolase
MIDDPKFDLVVEFIIQNDKTVMAHLGEPKNCWLPVEKMTVNNDKNYFKNHPEYHMFLHPDYPSYEAQIKARDNFVERHPNMRFVGAHLGSLEWSVDELAKRLDNYPNMAVDMAARIGHLQYQSQIDYEKVRQFFVKYQDRLIYATDTHIDLESDPIKSKNSLHNTWTEDWQYFTSDEKMTNSVVDGAFSGLKLPKEVIDKIFHHNAVRWFKMKD